jgi:signal transduction histidine kinase
MVEGLKTETAVEGPEQDASRGDRFRQLSHEILLSANRGESSLDFLISVSKLLVGYLDCDASELWLAEKKKCYRWEITRSPQRFYRLDDVDEEQMLAVIGEGLYWTGDAKKALESLSEESPLRGILTDSRSAGFDSLVLLPLDIGDEPQGLLCLKGGSAGASMESDLTNYQDLAQTLAIVIGFQNVRLAQKERVKELTCLYEIGKAASVPGQDVEQVLREVAGFLPPAWQYPDIVQARILLDRRTYATPTLGEVRSAQRADIVIEGKVRGFVEVGYVEDRPEIDEGPFLVEERNLITLIAREIAIIVDQDRAEKERAQLQEQLRHADRLATIGQLAAGVAHELNEPLGGILGFAQLARKHPEVPAQVITDLGKREAASHHAREVIRKLMLLARETPPSKRHVDLNKVVEDGMYFLESRSAKAGIDVALRLASEPLGLTADPAQLHQLLVNLVVNALQAMPDGGKLEVATGRHGGDVALEVRDTGEGMTRATQRKIFDPFFTTKDIGEGTGLGLAVVHGIVTAHGGRIRVESAPGKGTVFFVRLPEKGPNDELA